jgi:hypothetical protein
VKINVIKVILLTVLFFNIGLSQDDFFEFRLQKEGYYHFVDQKQVKNFSCLVSSSIYINFIKDHADSSYYYPLKVLWNAGGSVYYIMQPFPDNLDENMQKKVVQHVQMLKQVFTGVLLDWQQFCLFSPFLNIAEDAETNFGADTVSFSYSVVKDGQAAKIKKVFGLGGKLLQVVWRSGDMKIITNPSYGEADNKWLCYGWDSQIYQRDQISSAMTVGLELVFLKETWLPVRFDILAQTKEEPDKRTLSSIFFKDYIINEEFEVVAPPTESQIQNQFLKK